MTGVDSHGVEARGIGSVEIDRGTTHRDCWKAAASGFSLWPGGAVSANGVAITTSGILSLLSGFGADGAAALGGTIALDGFQHHDQRR